jgi:hypothetical protein
MSSIESFHVQELSQSKQAFLISPKISLIVQDAVFYIPSCAQKFIFILLIPYFIYFLLFKIYSKDVGLNWSALFAFLSLAAFKELSLHEFVNSIFTNVKINLSQAALPVIFNFPMPGLTTLYFIFVCYLISHSKKFLPKQQYLITLLVAMDFYINAIDSLFLILFWLVQLSVYLTRKKKLELTKAFTNVLFQTFLFFLLALPGVFNAKWQNLTESSDMITFLTVLGSLIIPLGLMLLVYNIQRVDRFELLTRFGYIYTFFAIEIVLIGINTFGFFHINLSILEHRIPQYFLHWLYYIPPIYYLTRPVYSYTMGSESNAIAASIRNLIHRALKIEIPIIIVLMLLASFYFLFPIINK